jgi:hypothetical protein
MNRHASAILVSALAIVACASAPASAPTASPVASPLPPPISTAIVVTARPSTPAAAIPTPVASSVPTPKPGALGAVALEYTLIDHFGAVGSENGIFYCDPDQFPVAHANIMERALAGFEELRKDAATLAAILTRLGYGNPATLTPDQKVAVYVENNKLRAITLEPEGASGYRFALSQRLASGGQRIEGSISGVGAITVARQTPTLLSCPICLPVGTRIDTPNGARAVETLRVGDVVWTQSARGERVAVSLAAIGQAIAPNDHRVVAVMLDDGRRVTASPGHPTRDGSPLGSLRPGDHLDGSLVVDVTLLEYGYGRTFDILPSGETGVYWTDGVPLGSTLWLAH